MYAFANLSGRKTPFLFFFLVAFFLFSPNSCQDACAPVDSLLAKTRKLEERIAELELELVTARAEVLKHESTREQICQQRESLQHRDVEKRLEREVANLNGKLEECKLMNAKLTDELGVVKADPVLSQEAASRRIRYVKLVGAEAPDDQATQFLLHLSLLKLQAADFDGALSSLREHLRGFWLHEEAVEGSANRSALVVGASDVGDLVVRLLREKEGQDLVRLVARALEARGLDADRQAAAALLRLLLSLNPYSASAWLSLASLELASGNRAEALQCCRVARLLAPYNATIRSGCRQQEHEAAAAAMKPHEEVEPKLFLLVSEGANVVEKNAMQLLFAVLSAQTFGFQVKQQLSAMSDGKSRKRKKSKEKRNSSEDATRFTSLRLDELSAGDVVVYLATSPPPSGWIAGARTRHVSLVVWSLSEVRELNSRLLFPFSRFHWSPPAVNFIFEPSFAPFARVIAAPAASVSSLPAGGGRYGWRLEPPPPSASGQVTRRTVPPDRLRALCIGSESKCSDVIHRVLSEMREKELAPVLLAKVVEVLDGSPAGEAGLRPEDLLLAFGSVSGGGGGEQRRLALEVEAKRGGILHVSVLRPSCGLCQLSLRVAPRAWSGSGLLGCRLSFADVALPFASSSATWKQAEVRYLPTSRGDGEEMVEAQVVVVQEEDGMVMETEELKQLIYKASKHGVTMMLDERQRARLTVAYPRAFLFPPEPANQSSSIITRLKRHGEDEEYRRELEKEFEGMQASFERSAVRLVNSTRLLFVAVALTPEEEEASLSFILSAKLHYPLASVEVSVLDSLRFWQLHAAAVEELMTRGWWNDVWISQISQEKGEEGGDVEGEAFSHWLALTSRLLGHSWRRTPYVSRVRAGERQLPLCFHPHKFSFSLHPPAPSEPPGLFLFHSLVKLGGVPFARELGDIEAALSGLGFVLPSTSSSSSWDQKLCSKLPAIRQLRHLAVWAAGEVVMPARRRELEQVMRRCEEEGREPRPPPSPPPPHHESHSGREQEGIEEEEEEEEKREESGALAPKEQVPTSSALQLEEHVAQSVLRAQVQAMLRSAELKEMRKRMKRREEQEQVRREEKKLQQLAASQVHPMFQRATDTAETLPPPAPDSLSADASPGRATSEEPRLCSLLLGLGVASGRWKILKLPEGGSAMKSGKLKQGDVLLRVGREDVQEATGGGIQRMLVGPAEEEVMLEVMDEEGERRNVSLARDC